MDLGAPILDVASKTSSNDNSTAANKPAVSVI